METGMGNVGVEVGALKWGGGSMEMGGMEMGGVEKGSMEMGGIGDMEMVGWKRWVWNWRK